MAIERTEDRLLTVAEVAERLRVHPITVRRHIKSGRLRAVRVGRSVRVRESDVEALLKPAMASDVRAPYQPALVTEEEKERRRKIVEEMRRRRAKMKPLGISTAELIREGRGELERRAERHLGMGG